jgi:hypothetical protein
MDDEAKVRQLTTLAKRIASVGTNSIHKILFMKRIGMVIRAADVRSAEKNKNVNGLGSDEEVDMADTEISTPDPQVAVIIYTVIRSLLQILGAFGITWGQTVSGSTWQQVAGAIAILIGLGWALYQKIQQARLDHAGNVASARAGKAIKVVAQDGVPPL